MTGRKDDGEGNAGCCWERLQAGTSFPSGHSDLAIPSWENGPIVKPPASARRMRLPKLHEAWGRTPCHR